MNIHTCPNCGQTRYETEDEKDERAVRARRRDMILLVVVVLAFSAGFVLGAVLT